MWFSPARGALSGGTQPAESLSFTVEALQSWIGWRRRIVPARGALDEILPEALDHARKPMSRRWIEVAYDLREEHKTSSACGTKVFSSPAGVVNQQTARQWISVSLCVECVCWIEAVGQCQKQKWPADFRQRAIWDED
jgi:hypothetical protein